MKVRAGVYRFAFDGSTSLVTKLSRDEWKVVRWFNEDEAGVIAYTDSLRKARYLSYVSRETFLREAVVR